MRDIVALFAFIFGSAIGSFLNVIILRLPRGEAVTGRSHCPHCGKDLRPSDLVPLASYLVLRGRCRFCGASISSRYFIIETLTGLLFMVVTLWFFPGNPAEAVVLGKALLFAAVLVVVFIVDFEHYIILDSVLLTGGVGVLIANVALLVLSRGPVLSWENPIFAAIAGGLVCALPFFLIWKVSRGRWMGFGDVKLAMFLGWALGWQVGLTALLLAVFLGGIAGLILLAFTAKTLKSRVPFGTFLSIGALGALFFGQQLLTWYLSLIGLR